MSDLDKVLARIDSDLDPALERLFALLSIPSISTDPAYAAECRRAADHLVADLAGLGFEARAADTPGHPIVVAHHRAGSGRSALFYGHYDVQPVDPLDQWEHDPFAPRLVAGADGRREIRARGASDDKGQVMTFIEACRAWKAETGALPIPVSIILEGEEETGGENLPPFLRDHADELKADIALICDTGMFDRNTPAITTMLRGLVGEEFVIRAADRDLHSGMYGSAARNPNEVVARILASLRDDRGRIVLKGFYDGVPELPAELRRQWDALGFDAGAFLGAIGLSEPAGEADRDALEMIWSRPTVEINGMGGGYQGAGFKTVIPAEARAKVSFRLVFDQDPKAIREAFRAHVRALTPPDCAVEFIPHGAAPATVFDLSDPAFEACRAALGAEWETEAAFVGSGGSIPVGGELRRILGMESILAGFALEDDRIHSPNEKYDLESFRKGTRAWARTLAALAEQG